MRTSEAKRLEIVAAMAPSTTVEAVDRSSTHVLATEYILDGVGGLFYFFGYEGDEHWEVKLNGKYRRIEGDLEEALSTFFGGNVSST